MTTSVEKWPNAPLIFVLVAVGFSQYPNFEKHVDNIHEATLADLPVRINSAGTTIHYDLANTGQAPRVTTKTVTRLLNPASGLSMFLRDDLLAIEMTQYAGNVSAMTVIERLLRAVLGALPSSSLHPQLLAMRYIDAVLKSEHETIENSVRNEFLGLQSLGGQASHTITNFSQQFSVNNLALTISVYRGAKQAGNIVLPPGLEIPDQLQPDKKLSQLRQHHGDFALLDFECTGACQGAADLEKIMGSFANIHSQLSDVLPKVATEAAVLRWQNIT
jgi:uncharacterized protein (TIGR04255 family)